jgi:cysteine synthase B
VYAKAEWTNPGGSVKDRAALSMIRDGERMGRLRPGMIVLDASSGNTGIAYALLGRELGYPVEIVLPANASRPRLRILDRLGAELVLTDPQEGMDGAIAEARMRRRHSVGRYFYPDQYNNPANWRAHYHGTAGEILDQTGGRITHFVAGLGTTGTFTGVARRLREEQPHVRLVAMQPDSPLHGLEGLKHLATVRVPGIHDPGLAHENRTASTESARTMRVRLFHDENLDVGPSAAAAALVAAEVAEKLERGVVVTVFPDGGEKYAEDPLWEVG